MATIGGPNIESDGLVFGYDTGYGVADNTTATRFYPGESTTNLVTTNLETVGTDGSGQSSVGTRTTIAPNHVRIVDVTSNTRQTHLIQGLTASATYTVSIQFKKLSGTPTFRFQLQGYNNSSYVNTIKFTNTAETGLLDIDGWQTAKWTFTLPSNANALRIWWQDGADYTTYTHSFELKNPQLEAKGHVTPYVSGTRSATASLIDLKRTTSIDVSNVSFDSTGQPDYDGTDDYIELGDSLNSIGSNASFEMVFKATETNDTYRIMLGWGNGNSNYSGIHIGSWTSGYTDESFHVTFNSSTTHLYVRKGHSYYKDNAFHHAVVTAAANNYKIWIDGVDETDTVIGGSTIFSEIVGYNSNITTQIGRRPYGGGTGYFKGEIPVLKVHDKVLSETEIKQNYNAYKNRFDI